MRTFQICVKGDRVQYAKNLHFDAVYDKDTNYTDVTIPAKDIQQAYNITKLYFRSPEPFHHALRRNKELYAKKKLSQ